MLEILFVFGAIFVLGLIVVATLKLALFVVVLPFKIAFFAFKGLLALVLLVPLAIVGFGVVLNLFPIILLLLALPIVLVVAAALFAFRLVA